MRLGGALAAAAVRFDYGRLDADVFDRLEHLNSSKRICSARRRATLLLALLELVDMVAFVDIPAGQMIGMGWMCRTCWR